MSIDTELPLPAIVDIPAPVAVSHPSFGAGKAILAFLILFVAQLIAGVYVVVVAMVLAAVRGANVGDEALIARIVNGLTTPTLIAAATFSVAAVIAAARLWAWPQVFDRSDDGLGLRPTRGLHIALWALVGASCSMLYMFVITLVPPDPSMPLGPLATAASNGGLNRMVWVVLALLFAPLVEEFFFRGMLLKGFANSWGFWPAAITVTILFVAMHLFETMNYWPATAAVSTMAVVALTARRTSGSLWPAIALHAGYNFVIAVRLFVG